jgi:hypothetical protein
MGVNDQVSFPEVVADIWVDRVSHNIVRFDLKPIPSKDFPVSDAELQTEYEDLPLGDGTHFILPTESTSNSCFWNEAKHRIAFCDDNLLQFKNCHKFGTSSRILTDGVTDSPK